MENLLNFNSNISPLDTEDSGQLDPYCQELYKEGRKYHTCTFPNCGKIFRFKSEFNRHSVIHGLQRPFNCPYSGCNKSFKREDALKNHVRIHSGELPYPCEVEGCDLSFSTKAALRYHLLKHNKERMFPCPLPGCGKSFFTLAQLRQHETGQNVHRKVKCDKNKNLKELKEEKPPVVKKVIKEKDGAATDDFFALNMKTAVGIQWETKDQCEDILPNEVATQDTQENFERMLKLILKGKNEKEQGVQMCATLMNFMEKGNVSEEDGNELSDDKIFSVLNFAASPKDRSFYF